MDLQITVFLLFNLFITGFSFNCYNCISTAGSCANQKVTSCPDSPSCISSTMITSLEGITTKSKIKGCLPHACIVENYNIADMSVSCCSTDLCNVKDAPEPSADPSTDVPKGKQCYYCDGQDCSKIRSCSGSEDRCIKAKLGGFGNLSFTSQGCVSKAVCDALSSHPNSQGISCCEGNLCNGAKSATQNFLFLCCSLLSFLIQH